MVRWTSNLAEQKVDLVYQVREEPGAEGLQAWLGSEAPTLLGAASYPCLSLPHRTVSSSVLRNPHCVMPSEGGAQCPVPTQTRPIKPTPSMEPPSASIPTQGELFLLAKDFLSGCPREGMAPARVACPCSVPAKIRFPKD